VLEQVLARPVRRALIEPAGEMWSVVTLSPSSAIDRDAAWDTRHRQSRGLADPRPPDVLIATSAHQVLARSLLTIWSKQ
jgi:hypothetical protein